ncbi:hypothetical protein niasHT_003970 [Heterodera trifolii]|uniref:MULE transposase domain-containing protein n=1 Tax=Heterodera trifolii TaxID=157864 RepID=A0ABD2M566_9BILA
MPTVREILESLQKPIKRPRNPTNEDSVLNVERTAAEQQMEGVSTSNDLNVGESDDEENWFRFLKIRSDGSWFRCERRNCPATAKLEDEELMTGVLGPKEHHHVKENPKQHPSQLRAQIRTDIDDEVFELLGTNEALDQMTNRAKNKFVGKVNCGDPLQIQIPAGLLKKDDESVLIYDSREVRLFSMLKQNRRWSLDGTFRSAPKPWTQVFVIGCYVNNRMVVAAQALLCLLKRQMMCDFATGMLKAMRHVFPSCERSGCNFHMAQALFRKARSMDIFHLFAENNAEALGQRKSVQKHSDQSSRWHSFLHFTFALQPLSMKNRLEFKDGWRILAKTTLVPLNSRLTMERRHLNERITAWKPHMANSQYNKILPDNFTTLPHNPSLMFLFFLPTSASCDSDIIAAFTKDIDKQLDIGRAEQLQKSRTGPQRYIIKEQNVVRILDEADFESEEGLTNSVHLLGLVMQGFAEGLHVRGNSESGEETEADEN